MLQGRRKLQTFGGKAAHYKWFLEFFLVFLGLLDSNRSTINSPQHENLLGVFRFYQGNILSDGHYIF